MIPALTSLPARTLPGLTSRRPTMPGEKFLAVGIVFFVLIPAALTFLTLEFLGMNRWLPAVRLNVRPGVANFRWARYLAWLKPARPEPNIFPSSSLRGQGLTRTVRVINPASRTPGRTRPRCRAVTSAVAGAVPISFTSSVMAVEKQKNRFPHTGSQNLFTLS